MAKQNIISDSNIENNNCSSEAESSSRESPSLLLSELMDDQTKNSGSMTTYWEDYDISNNSI